MTNKEKFTVVEFDNDYKTIVGFEDIEFANLQDAEDYCNRESWDGYTYFVRKSRLKKA